MVLQNSKDILYSSLPEETSFTSPTDDQGRIQLRVLILCAAIKAGEPKGSKCKQISDPSAHDNSNLPFCGEPRSGFILNGQVKQHDLRVKRFQPDPIN
ncbi:hypothetical protein PSHT_10685 [Puccinia striiformis]|uniref:Uncharacterized protein n=1 Tax=Puccinia striiformis TaxID=27350 RepID=A0A2S4V828_9BASI|nr:hypothetical protein PSHT_10685 [Puccinia striiformis]